MTSQRGAIPGFAERLKVRRRYLDDVRRSRPYKSKLRNLQHKMFCLFARVGLGITFLGQRKVVCLMASENVAQR